MEGQQKMKIRGSEATFGAGAEVVTFDWKERYFEGPGGSKIKLNFAVMIGSSRVHAKHMALEAETAALVSFLRRTHDPKLGCTIVVEQGDQESWQLTSSDSKTTAAVRAMMTKITKGTVAMNGDHPAWHEGLMDLISLEWLSSICRDNQVYIERNGEEKRHFMWGLAQDKEACNLIISRQIRRMIEADEVVAEFGILENERRRKPIERIEREVCLSEASKPLRPACGHVYCQECFDFMCVEETEVPIRCLGADCSQVISLPG